MFATFTYFDKPIDVQIGDSGFLQETGKGDVLFTFTEPKVRNVVLPGVWYAPKGGFNPSSSRKIVQFHQCFSPTTDKQEVMYHAPRDQVVGYGEDTCGTSIISGHSNVPKSLITTQPQSTSLSTWHSRLGHLGITNLTTLLSSCNTPFDTEKRMSTWEPCELGKQSKVACPHKTVPCESEKFSVICSDLAGPFRTEEAIGGYRFYGTCNDVSPGYFSFATKAKCKPTLGI